MDSVEENFGSQNDSRDLAIVTPWNQKNLARGPDGLLVFSIEPNDGGGDEERDNFCCSSKCLDQGKEGDRSVPRRQEQQII